MKHVTYLLGAGASYNALPLNSDLVAEIKSIVDSTEQFLENIVNQSYLDTFRKVYGPLIEEASGEFSIDTLALENIDNPQKLHNIKVLLWIYFSGKAGKNVVNKRYKPPLLKLKDKWSQTYRLRQGVSFLSWNYDLQLEEVYAGLSKSDLSKVPNSLYTYPSVKFVNPGSLDRKSAPEIFQLIHLNGSAGYYYDQERKIYDSWFNCDFSDNHHFERMLDLVINKFHINGSYKNALTNCINFAGEEVSENNQKEYYAKKIAEITTHLVIIGYSLPDYNREIDRKIIEQMKNLEYIVIQDTKADDVEQKLLSKFPFIKEKINNYGLFLHKDKDCIEFHLPPHL